MKFKTIAFTVVIILCLILYSSVIHSQVDSYLLVPMDESQKQHLRAYGLVYQVIDEREKSDISWFLNYRGGSFLLPDTSRTRRMANLRGISVEAVDGSRVEEIRTLIEKNNMREVPLEVAPEIAVYSPPGMDPWDDAVTLALESADIPFDTIYDKEVLNDRHLEYDWLHLHHEDFSGQFGKFYASYRNAAWYLEKVEDARNRAERLGFGSVRKEKVRVAQKIADYVRDGGFLFAMCSAPESLDVALATGDYDCVAPEISGTPVDDACYDNSNYDYDKTFAFKDFELVIDPNVYEISNIDISPEIHNVDPKSESFQLFDFSARYDPIPAVLTQNHRRVIKGFMGQASTFNPDVIKSHVIEMAHLEDGRAKYVYGPYGEGIFSFLSGHDPEDFAHYVGDPHTDLSSHPSSPGYRLILNNILFPAVEKPELKT